MKSCSFLPKSCDLTANIIRLEVFKDFIISLAIYKINILMQKKDIAARLTGTRLEIYKFLLNNLLNTCSGVMSVGSFFKGRKLKQ